jgi:hypothetical protein
MSVSSLPATTTPPATQSAGVGGIIPTKFQIPAMPAVANGGQLFDNRMEATKLLMSAGTGNLKGGGKKKIKKTKYKKSRNHIVKVMRGCNNKKTKKNKMIFRGGASLITPSITSGEIEVPVPVGASPTQTSVLSNLTTQFLKAQVLNSNIPPPIPTIIPSKFMGGGGIVNSSRYKNRKTNQKRLRYKKSIGRRSRSRRRHYKHRR